MVTIMEKICVDFNVTSFLNASRRRDDQQIWADLQTHRYDFHVLSLKPFHTFSVLYVALYRPLPGFHVTVLGKSWFGEASLSLILGELIALIEWAAAVMQWCEALNSFGSRAVSAAWIAVVAARRCGCSGVAAREQVNYSQGANKLPVSISWYNGPCSTVPSSRLLAPLGCFFFLRRPAAARLLQHKHRSMLQFHVRWEKWMKTVLHHIAGLGSHLLALPPLCHVPPLSRCLVKSSSTPVSVSLRHDSKFHDRRGFHGSHCYSRVLS